MGELCPKYPLMSLYIKVIERKLQFINYTLLQYGFLWLNTFYTYTMKAHKKKSIQSYENTWPETILTIGMHYFKGALMMCISIFCFFYLFFTMFFFFSRMMLNKSNNAKDILDIIDVGGGTYHASSLWEYVCRNIYNKDL